MPEKIEFRMNDIDFLLEWKSGIIQLEGNSGTGKTFFFEMLKQYISAWYTHLRKAGLPLPTNRNVRFIDYKTPWPDIQKIIDGAQQEIICIDNANILFRTFPELSKLITKNSKNFYILAGRGIFPKLSVSHEAIYLCKLETTSEGKKFKFYRRYM